MRYVRSVILGFGISLLGVASPVHAEHCRWHFDKSFTLLSNKNLHLLEKGSRPYDIQAKVEAEVEFLFGPRPTQCEEGAYSLFLARYERYATEAVRGARADRDLKLRAAIAVIRKSPEIVDYTSASQEVSKFRQMRANLGALAQDVGMTPLLQELLDATEAVGAPKATPRPNPTPPDPHVTEVAVPTVPLPAWAVISLYEIDDHTRRNDMGAIQGKIQAILNWMKTSTASVNRE